jgi:hypothetical protein
MVIIRRLEVKEGKYLVIGSEASVIPDGTGAVGGYLSVSYLPACEEGKRTAKASDHSSDHLSPR